MASQSDSYSDEKLRLLAMFISRMRTLPTDVDFAIHRKPEAQSRKRRKPRNPKSESFWLGFAAAMVILPVSVLAYVWLGLAGVQANVPPPAWERHLMTTAVRISVARRAEREKPETAGLQNEDQLVAGGKLYMNGCAGCHGELGKPFREDRSLYPPVPQLPHVGTQYTEPQVYWIVKHGTRMTAMSACRPFYSEKELWLLAEFVHEIRSLPSGVQERILAKPKDSVAIQ